MNRDAIRQTALAAAHRGGEVLRRLHGQVSASHKSHSSDLVTEADIGSERAIIATLRAAFPDHGIWAEESGRSAGQDDALWIIDPLDGTTNFAHGLELFCISIACAIRQEVVLGVVLAPLTGELYLAERGRGATLNGRRLQVSAAAQPSESLLVTGFAYNFRDQPAAVLARFNRCLLAAQGVRRLGSAALDLCRVARGQFDAFWEENLKPWDTAAGMLIVREAGGAVTDFSNRPYTPHMAELLASNGRVHAQMLTLLRHEEHA
jgi:myo-inositol-1(or 4)-monophosphatase